MEDWTDEDIHHSVGYPTISYNILEELKNVARLFVCASNKNGSLWGLPQSEWFLMGLCSARVVPLGEQFVCIELEFTEYHREKCTWHTTTYRKYYFV